MTEVHPEIACHTPAAGKHAIRLHGGPWDNKIVGVSNPRALMIQVNGPRNGNHTVWITHLYERHGDQYEFARTDVEPLGEVT